MENVIIFFSDIEEDVVTLAQQKIEDVTTSDSVNITVKDMVIQQNTGDGTFAKINLHNFYIVA